MEIISRKEAIERGLKHYFTGVPCKHGHVCERAVSGNCVLCNSDRSKKWQDNNRERLNENQREWRQKNLAKVREQQRKKNHKWYRNNREYFIDYYQDNKDRIRTRNRAWFQNNPQKRSSYEATRRAREQGALGEYTNHDIENLMHMQRAMCAECRKGINTGYHVDHIMPLSKGGSNYPHNLQLLCPSCNCSKHAKDPVDWAQQNGRLL